MSPCPLAMRTAAQRHETGVPVCQTRLSGVFTALDDLSTPGSVKGVYSVDVTISAVPVVNAVFYELAS